MTTTVKIHVNGRYRTTVKQTDEAYGERVTVIDGTAPDGGNEKSFYLPHPAKGTFELSEEYMGDAPATE